MNGGIANRKGRGETIIKTITEKDNWDPFKEAAKQAGITGLKEKLLRELVIECIPLTGVWPPKLPDWVCTQAHKAVQLWRKPGAGKA